MLPLYDNIRRRRIELGMSQQELAEKAGYTDRSSIAKIETGKVDLTQSKIIAIAKALEISPGTLMGWTTIENKVFWRYTSIENDKIVLKFPEISDDIKDTSADNDKGDVITHKIAAMGGMEEDNIRTLSKEQMNKWAELIEATRDLPSEKIDMLIKMAESIK